MPRRLTFEICQSINQEADERLRNEPYFSCVDFVDQAFGPYTTEEERRIMRQYNDRQSAEWLASLAAQPVEMLDLFKRLSTTKYTDQIAVASLNKVVTSSRQQYFLPLGIANNRGFSLILDCQALEAHQRRGFVVRIFWVLI